MSGPISEHPRLHRLGRPSDFDRVRESAGTDTSVIVLRTGDGTSRSAFFDTVRARAPLDPPLSTDRSWDALLDSLSAGLWQSAEGTILIAWLDASRFEAACSEEHAIAVDVLVSTCVRLSESRGGPMNPKDAQVYLA